MKQITFTVAYMVPGATSTGNSYFTNADEASKQAGGQSMPQTVRIFERSDDKKIYDALLKMTPEEVMLLGYAPLAPTDLELFEKNLKILYSSLDDLDISGGLYNVIKSWKANSIFEVIETHQAKVGFSAKGGVPVSGLIKHRAAKPDDVALMEKYLNENKMSLDMNISPYIRS